MQTNHRTGVAKVLIIQTNDIKVANESFAKSCTDASFAVFQLASVGEWQMMPADLCSSNIMKELAKPYSCKLGTLVVVKIYGFGS